MANFCLFDTTDGEGREVGGVGHVSAHLSRYRLVTYLQRSCVIRAPKRVFLFHRQQSSASRSSTYLPLQGEALVSHVPYSAVTIAKGAYTLYRVPGGGDSKYPFDSQQHSLQC